MGKKRARSQNDDEVNRRLIASVFQDDLSDGIEVSIILHDKEVYRIQKDVLLRQSDSALAAMMRAGMKEDNSHVIHITDDENLFTAQAVKMLFGALAFGSYVIQHASYDVEHFMILPLLVHYLYVDVSIATAAMQAMATRHWKKRHINHAAVVLNTINRYLSSMTPPADVNNSDGVIHNEYSACLEDHKSAIYRQLAEVLSQYSTKNDLNCWNLLNADDMRSILRLISDTILGVYEWNDKDNTLIVRRGKNCYIEDVALHTPRPPYIVANTRLVNDENVIKLSFLCLLPHEGYYNCSAHDALMTASKICLDAADLQPQNNFRFIEPKPKNKRYYQVAAYRLQIQYNLVISFVNSRLSSETQLKRDYDTSCCILALRHLENVLDNDSMNCSIREALITMIAMQRYAFCGPGGYDQLRLLSPIDILDIVAVRPKTTISHPYALFHIFLLSWVEQKLSDATASIAERREVISVYKTVFRMLRSRLTKDFTNMRQDAFLLNCFETKLALTIAPIQQEINSLRSILL